MYDLVSKNCRDWDPLCWTALIQAQIIFHVGLKLYFSFVWLEI